MENEQEKPIQLPVTERNQELMKDSLNKIRTFQEHTTD